MGNKQFLFLVSIIVSLASFAQIQKPDFLLFNPSDDFQTIVAAISNNPKCKITSQFTSNDGYYFVNFVYEDGKDWIAGIPVDLFISQISFKDNKFTNLRITKDIDNSGYVTRDDVDLYVKHTQSFFNKMCGFGPTNEYKYYSSNETNNNWYRWVKNGLKYSVYCQTHPTYGSNLGWFEINISLND